MKHPDRFRKASAEEIARLLGWMPIIVRAYGVPDWDRRFCASMIARNRRAAFKPSAKQVATMFGIVAAYQAQLLGRDE